MIHHGDCLAILPTLDAESVDAIVTDPPYDLTTQTRGGSASTFVDNPYGRARIGTKEFSGRGGFMGKTWDGTGVAFRAETWAECYRVAKPGAHLLAFGGTRTYHRLASAIEDAGWEIRDTLVWAYAQGFPKSHNLTGDRQGWGTALKPAWEPIVLARKPLRGTVAANVTEYGTGALNIDGCRIEFASDADAASSVPASTPPSTGERGSMAGPLPRKPFDRHGGGAKGTSGFANGYEKGSGFVESAVGRWPANVILTDPIFDGGVAGVVGGGAATTGGDIRTERQGFANDSYMGNGTGAGSFSSYGDSGTYSRFFLIPKAARSDREPVIASLPARTPPGWSSGEQSPGTFQSQPTPPRANVHPTVKPTDLMRHLVRLVTPPGGVVLDPFLGSGTTALACEMEGFGWVGIEREAEYVAIAEARLNGTQRGLGLEHSA